MTDISNANTAPTLSEQPSLALSISNRLNAAFKGIAQGQLMQNDTPFLPVATATGSVVIGVIVSPRDCEIMASIFEAIDRGDFAHQTPEPSEEQLTIPGV